MIFFIFLVNCVLAIMTVPATGYKVDDEKAHSVVCTGTE